MNMEKKKNRVKIYSRKMMEERLTLGKIENAAIISFYAPNDHMRGVKSEIPIDYTGKCNRVMQIALHDLDPHVLADYGLTVDTYFPEADLIADFIFQAKNDGLDIICQCEYGQSRSAGCAAAILQYFGQSGIKVFADYRYYPNQLIYHKVFDALNKYKKNH